MIFFGKNFSFINKAVKWVCKASQVRTEDGKSVEDKLEEISTNGGGSGSSGSGMLKLSLFGFGSDVLEDDYKQYNIIEDEEVESSSENFVLKSQTDAILAAPVGTIIAFMDAENNDGNIYDTQLSGFGFKTSDSDSDGGLSVISCSGEYVESVAIIHEGELCNVYLKDEGGGGSPKKI